MFDIKSVSKRYFEIKLTMIDDSGNEKSIELQVEPPKVKVLKKLVAVKKSAKEEAMDELVETVGKILSKNRANYKVPMEYIDELDFDQMNEILTAYFEWLNNEKNSKN